MKMFKILSLVILSAAVFTSCKDDDESCNLTATSIQGTYKATSIKYKLNASTPEVEVFNTTSGWYDACELDDTYTIDATNFTYTDAGTTCTTNPTPDVSTYTLTGSTLTVTSGGDTFPFNVTEFNCNSMKLVGQNSDVTGDQITITLVRQ